jgi:hypothetical protein
MNDASQLATAVLALAFAAVLLITGQRFMDYRLQHEALQHEVMAPKTVVATLPP